MRLGPCIRVIFAFCIFGIDQHRCQHRYLLYQEVSTHTITYTPIYLFSFSCLYSHVQAASWIDAYYNCKSKQMVLASINSDADYSQIEDDVQNLGKATWTAGLYYLEEWIWEPNGRPIDVKYFNSDRFLDKPENRCIMLKQTQNGLKLHNQHCDQQFQYICEDDVNGANNI